MSSKELLQFIAPPSLLVLSVVLRSVVGKSARLRLAWVFLSLWLTPFLISFLPSTWNPGIEPIVNIAHALVELAAVQLAAVIVCDIILRRFQLNKLMVHGAVAMASFVVLINLLYRLGVTPTGILATCALTIGIVVFALQETVSSIAGGILMNLNGGIKVGDYIRCEEWSGWVESLSLRQTTIKDLDGDVIILPNSQINRAAVRIYASLRRRIVPFVMSHGADSQEVIETAEFAMRASPMEGIAVDPPPVCTIQQMSASAVTYAITIWVTGPGDHDAEASTVLTRVGFALERAGLPIGAEHDPQKPALTAIELLRRAPILRLLQADDLARLASSMRRSSFAPGELIVRQGEPGESMYFIGKGKVSVLFNSGDGVERQVALMSGGDFFGEASLLTGEARSATVQAVSRIDCYELPKEGLHEFIHSRSGLVGDIATVMAQRQMELKQVREKLDAETAQAREAEARQNFMSSVQRFFGWVSDGRTNPGQGSDVSFTALPAPPPSATSPKKPDDRLPPPPAARDTQMPPLARTPIPVRTERLDSSPAAGAARERAARLMNDGKYDRALEALTEADAIDNEYRESAARRIARETRKIATPRRSGTVDKAMNIVNRYSKIAAGAGFVPGAFINFAAILTVQVMMVWKVARCFGYKEPADRVRGSIMSLLASGIPAVVGHGTAIAVTTTAFVAGSVLYFLFTPVLAYAVTQAVGRTFVMHFESGRTLLTFDAMAFQDYFLTEFQRAYGKSGGRQSVAA